ncbi:uncharacterized protein LOC130736256 [Lotus japonicus]|uniref:uncharacterized protein LOC130736256 n=1 Tax=Lotus japonicus TaxID=34305 RepID=UPI00258C9320|nr:uncharacterized protein LOC130736256 [Lotus japonicus]
MSRLDRVLVSHEWILSWPDSVQQVLDREISDHCPLLLRLARQDWGPQSFRALNCWLKDSRFKPFVESNWSLIQALGWGAFVIQEKLKCLKLSLRQWNKDIFGNITTKRKGIVKELNNLDKKAEEVSLNAEEVAKRKDLGAELWRLATLNESLLCQKARTSWIKEGDANTRFFHGMINWRRRGNSLFVLDLEGRWREDPSEIRLAVKDFFDQKYREVDWASPTLDGITFRHLFSANNNVLIAPFDIEEIREAVWDCDGDKSPRPDGYNFKFIKSFWHILKDDFLRMLQEFHAHGKWPRGTNTLFIALISKVDSPQGLRDFRHIFFVGCMYKVVSKILAKRLKGVLPKLIDESQSAFLDGRNMLDSILIANEVVHDANRKGVPTMVFKVDYEKAYDSIKWNFLFYMIERMKFDRKWISWIRGCLSSSSVSVLVNGSPTEEFKMEKGLRQGDQIALFLFLIVAEGISGMIKNAISLGRFSPYNCDNSSALKVSLLQLLMILYSLERHPCKMRSH